MVFTRRAPPVPLRIVAVAVAVAVAGCICGKSKVDRVPPAPASTRPTITSADPRLRWVNAEGGGAGFLPVGEKDEESSRSFFAVGDSRGVKSVMSSHIRAAIAIDADQLCGVVPTLAGMRDRVSIDIFVGKPITGAVAECIHDIHPPALAFAAPQRGPLSAVMMLILMRLDDCEALGVDHAGDEVAQLLGERADSPDGAALRSVALPGSQLGPGALAALAKRKKLREIALRGMSSTLAAGSADAGTGKTGLGALAGLPELERLDLSYGPVTDDDLEAFAGAKALRWLMLESSGVGDAGIAHFAGSPDLEYINLDFTKVGDAGVEAIGVLQHVHTMTLVRSAITDRGATALARMKSLRVVNLALTSVTEAGVEALLTLPALRELSLPKTIAAASVDRWKRAHPRVRIDHSP